ncbi:MAG TPA: AMP-binding protein [Solirubrobacteraceae bacterium]|nr:AMP-binding protein [Solirubrobacteraceae bacterium]
MEPWLSRAARVHPERAALVTPRQTWSYRELHAAAGAVAGALHEWGIGHGDRVGLALPSDELIVALHACLAIGAAAVPIDLRLTDAERVVRLNGVARTLTELPSGPPAAERPLDLSDTATVMYTSGTTAGPKRVELSLSNWLWNAIGSAVALGLDPEERWLCPMPLAHVGGLSIALRSAIYGTTVVLHERFDTDAVRDALLDPRQRVTLVSLVPTMLGRLLDAGLREPPALRRVLLGGGPIAPALLARAREASIEVAPSFGMTETCSQIATDGIALFGAELTLSDAGELLVRGPSVARGAISGDGWLHTGDLGRFDESGRLEIVGRTADTIVSGGENVAPTEVEAVLVEHDAISDAAVVGRADPEWGEIVVALIVPRLGWVSGHPDGAAIDGAMAEDLREFCGARLAGFKVPKRFELVESLPRGATGKLQRRELH